MFLGSFDYKTVVQDAGVWKAVNPRTGQLEAPRLFTRVAQVAPDEAQYWESYWGFGPGGAPMTNAQGREFQAIARDAAARPIVSGPGVEIKLYRDNNYRAFNPATGLLELVYFVPGEQMPDAHYGEVVDAGTDWRRFAPTYYYESDRPRGAIQYTYEDPQSTGFEFGVKAGLAAIASVAIGALASQIMGLVGSTAGTAGGITTAELAAAGVDLADIAAVNAAAEGMTAAELAAQGLAVDASGSIVVTDTVALAQSAGVDYAAAYEAASTMAADAAPALTEGAGLDVAAFDPGAEFATTIDTAPAITTPADTGTFNAQGVIDKLKPLASKLLPLAQKLLNPGGSQPQSAPRSGVVSQPAGLTAGEKEAMLLGGGLLAAAGLAVLLPRKRRARR